MKYRPLEENEIQTLKNQGCVADNWEQIQVKYGFNPERVIHVRFGTAVRLGVFDEDLEVDQDILKPAGIYNSYLHDCTIGDNVYIADVKTMAHYDVDSRVIIENVASLMVASTSTFGNGVTIEVLNEGGGRDLVIFDKLSAQIAYLMSTWRHDDEFIQKLTRMIQVYAEGKSSNRGRIQTGAKISHCGVIRNVHFGPNAQVRGAQVLEEGTIASCPEQPTVVGAGVIAKDFIILSGSRVDGCAMLSRCFVSQAVQVGKQFSAENSAIFANSECFHGEACSIFAGPYSVTHHNSTLLIAGLFSFFNAGSGTNQSNHMYKLGPLHQGILERGCKTGSFCYLLWPARVGAFTAVVGKHYANFDSSDLPFSYISENNGRSTLTPAMNLFTVGTRRDSVKWPNRDRRLDPDKLDLIDFELFNPYTVGKILQGLRVLDELAEKASKESEYVSYNGLQIKRLLLKTCRKYYEMAVKIYLGNTLSNRLGTGAEYSSFSQVLAKLAPENSEGSGTWIDLSGMIAPLTTIQKLTNRVAGGAIKTIVEVLSELREIQANYAQMAWRWCLDLLLARLEVPLADLNREHLVTIIREGAENHLKLNNMILKDAEKEFDLSSHIGYGLDGDAEVREKDFEAVRGSYLGNKFVLEVQKESRAIMERAEKWAAWFKNLPD